MIIKAYLSQADAVRAGADDFGHIEVAVSPHDLSSTQREGLARLLEGDAPKEMLRDGRIVVRGPSTADLIDAAESVPLRSSNEKEIDRLFEEATGHSPEGVTDRERLRVIRDYLFEPLDCFSRYEPAADVGHTDSCSRAPKPHFVIEKIESLTDGQEQELQRIAEAAAAIPCRVTVEPRLHRGSCPECEGWARLYGALVTAEITGITMVSRELSLPH